MDIIVGIQKDDYTNATMSCHFDASSPRWSNYLEENDCKVLWLDVYRPDFFSQLEGCHAFMWRWAHFGGMFQIAKRIIPIIQNEIGLFVYPDINTCWHYDDKIAQSYLFKVKNIPTPNTWCFYRKSDAKLWLGSANFPIVLKLAGGAGSENVKLLTSQEESLFWLDRLFKSGVGSLNFNDKSWNLKKSFRAAAKAMLKGKPLWSDEKVEWPLEKNYFFIQEFLKNNKFDVRVTVIGNRAFAFRRFNRDNDFRASGSGKIDYNQDKVDKNFIRLAFEVSKKLKMSSCAIDGLYKEGVPVVGEVSYTYVSGAVYNCPGHWVLDGEPFSGRLNWVEGHMWPEEAQVQDFLALIRSSAK